MKRNFVETEMNYYSDHRISLRLLPVDVSSGVNVIEPMLINSRIKCIVAFVYKDLSEQVDKKFTNFMCIQLKRLNDYLTVTVTANKKMP